MAWIIGIDEAGYGPNLGPLVMTSVACRVPEELAGADLWQVLEDGVRRPLRHRLRIADCGLRIEDHRPLVADSKLVYSPARGLHDLELGVLALLASESAGQTGTLDEYLTAIGPTSCASLRGEVWYSGTSTLPVEAPPELCQQAAQRFQQACLRQQLLWGPTRSVAVCPPQFNQLLEQWGSKGAVLGHALTELLEFNLVISPGDGDGEALHFHIDKHGGRNTYVAMLQNALAEGVVVAVEEGRNRSHYRVLSTVGEVTLTFQPRADVEHFCVALASMASKYLRELLMREFNAFWQAQVPALKPTAGYPADAGRFFDAIRPAAQCLGVAEAALWRRK